MLSDLPPGFVQLRPRPQVRVQRLAADPAGQVVLRPVAAVTGLGARAVRRGTRSGVSSLKLAT